MDINKLSIVFLRDYVKDWFYISNTNYLNYSPVAEPEKETYKITHPDRHDSVTYIKHKYQDKWLYYTDNKLQFKPLQLSHTIFSEPYYHQPLVLYFMYIGDAYFFLYRNYHFADRDIDYVMYSEKDGKINIRFTKNKEDATIFRYKYIKWKEELNHNLHGKAINQGLKNVHFGR